MRNGSVVAAVGDRRRVRGAGGKSLRSLASGNPLSYRFDVCRVGAGKQRRELKVPIAGLVGVVEVARKFPRVFSNIVIIGA